MEKKLFVVRRLSKKGTYFVALGLDFGYREALLSFDRYLIAELLDIPFSQLEALKVDERIYIKS